MAKEKSKFVCGECGYETVKWFGKCPSCGSWNTLVEEERVLARPIAASGAKAVPLENVRAEAQARVAHRRLALEDRRTLVERTVELRRLEEVVGEDGRLVALRRAQHRGAELQELERELPLDGRHEAEFGALGTTRPTIW